MDNKPKLIDTKKQIFSCRVCGDKNFHQTFHIREMMFGTREKFNYFQCSECKCLQIAEIPPNLSTYYPSNYYSLQRNNEPRHRTISYLRRYLEHIRVKTALFSKGYKLNSLSKLFVDLPPEINPAGPLLKDCEISSWDTYKTDWVELDAPRHLYLHSLKSIELLGNKVGLKLIKTKWDSGAFEFYGSEQYRRDIPLIAENSFWRTPSKSDFTYREMANFSAMATKANLEGRGGRACFIFRSID